MWTNFFDAAATNFCRGLNGIIGHFPSACLTNGGQPALFLATAALILLGAIGIVGWRRSRP